MDTHTHYDTAAHVEYVEAYTVDALHNVSDQRNTKREAQLETVEFGSGWYHDAAIADRTPGRKYEA